MDDIRVAGVGMTRFARRQTLAPGAQGADAVRLALADAGMTWDAVDVLVVGAVACGMSAAPQVLAHLPRTGVAALAVENASATGSTAFAQAHQAIAAGAGNIAVAVGIGSLEQELISAGLGSGKPELAGVTGANIPPVVFALRKARRMFDFGEGPEAAARVVVKNSANASSNPAAQRRQVVSLDDVLASPVVAEPLHRLECCPLGDGAAAAVLVAGDRRRAVPVLASVSTSDAWHPGGAFQPDPGVTARTALVAYRSAGVRPDDLDVVEVHDAFSVEELDYAEELGLCRPGDAAQILAAGEFDIGGRVAISPSGGLLARGHPGGATGIAQIVELVTQLRGEADSRQHHGARLGLAHMIGAGGVCVIHVFGGST